MSEETSEIMNENEASKELSSSNNTLTARQLREQAVKELGISYDDSIAMPMTELKKKIEEKNDPHFAKKQEWIQADKYITEVQKEEPVDNTPEEIIEPAVDQPTEVTNVIQFPTPEATTGNESTKKNKLSAKSLAMAAMVAITALGSIGATDKSGDSEKVSSGENADTATANSQDKQNTDSIFDLVKFNPQGFNEKDYNRSEQHVRDRMSTEGAFDGEKRNLAELDDHVLAKIKNNPSLMAAVLEVRESGNKDANFSLDDVNTDTRKFSVHGEHGQYSGKGQDAQDTLESSWDRGNQGKLLSDSEVRELMSKYVFINHGTNEGEFKNSIDDTTYSAGVFDYQPDLGDKVYKKKLGNGETVYFKVNKKDATRDCLNVQTLRLKSDITTTPGAPGVPTPPENNPPTTDTPPTPPEEPPKTPEEPTPEKPPGHTPKGPAHGSDDGTRQYGNNGEIHGNDGPEDQQAPSAGNNTNVDTGTSENAANNGSGSSDTAPNATPSAPDRDPSDAGQLPGAGTPNTNNGDPGQP